MTPPPTTMQRATGRTYRQMTDEELLLDVRRGDGPAYAELYRRYEREAIVFARSLVGRQDAEDVVGEAFTKMLNALRRGNGPVDHPVRYLMVTVRTSAATLRGRHARDRTLTERLGGSEPLTDGALAEADEQLVRAFRSLSAKRRQVLWWAEVEALSPTEIGDRLGINAAAASALAYRARQALRAAHRAELEAEAEFDLRASMRGGAPG